MIIKLHERCKTLLPNNNDIVCNHHRNIEFLLIENFILGNGLAPPLAESMCHTRNDTLLRNFGVLTR